MPDTPTPPQPSETASNSPDPASAPKRKWRRPKLAEYIAALAIAASIATFLFGLEAQEHQNAAVSVQTNRGLLLQLRDQYPRITSLLEHPPSSGIELETTLAIATNLLHSLRSEASGADFLFIGDAYRTDHYPELAIPLYKDALARLTQPADKITALRGIGYAEALIENSSAANAAMKEAVTVNADSGYPSIAKYNTEASTQRVWSAVAATLHECTAATEHAQQYADLHREHLPEPNWGPAPGEPEQVKATAKACR